MGWRRSTTIQLARRLADYLLRSPANRARLLQAVADVEAARNVVAPDQTLFA